MSTRLKEHIKHKKKEKFEKSELVEHSTITKHGILFDKTQIFANIPRASG